MSARWVDVAGFTMLCVVLTMAFGRFERHKPAWKRVAKVAVLVALLFVLIEILGRAWAYTILGLLLTTGTAFHFAALATRGINGWTGEPRDRFEALLLEIQLQGERRTLLRLARDLLPRGRGARL